MFSSVCLCFRLSAGLLKKLQMNFCKVSGGACTRNNRIAVRGVGGPAVEETSERNALTRVNVAC